MHRQRLTAALLALGTLALGACSPGSPDRDLSASGQNSLQQDYSFRRTRTTLHSGDALGTLVFTSRKSMLARGFDPDVTTATATASVGGAHTD